MTKQQILLLLLLARMVKHLMFPRLTSVEELLELTGSNGISNLNLLIYKVEEGK